MPESVPVLGSKVSQPGKQLLPADSLRAAGRSRAWATAPVLLAETDWFKVNGATPPLTRETLYGWPMTAVVWPAAGGIAGFGSTLIVVLADWLLSLTELAVMVTANSAVTVAGGLYVAAVVVVPLKLPQELAEQVGVAQVTPAPVESFRTVALKLAVLAWSMAGLSEVTLTDTCAGGGVVFELVPPPPQP